MKMGAAVVVLAVVVAVVVVVVKINEYVRCDFWTR
jgi:hypothetical protein